MLQERGGRAGDAHEEYGGDPAAELAQEDQGHALLNKRLGKAAAGAAEKPVLVCCPRASKRSDDEILKAADLVQAARRTSHHQRGAGIVVRHRQRVRLPDRHGRRDTAWIVRTLTAPPDFIP